MVPLKGAFLDWVIQQCARDLERLGHYSQVTLKSDQEAAIVDVMREIANLRRSRGTLEHSTVADSQSNGFIVRGIRSVEEMTRVFLFDLSSRVGSPTSVHSREGFRRSQDGDVALWARGWENVSTQKNTLWRERETARDQIKSREGDAGTDDVG